MEAELTGETDKKVGLSREIGKKVAVLTKEKARRKQDSQEKQIKSRWS